MCRLCLQEKQLINKSHIIPDFMYKELYDDQHKLMLFKPHERVKGKGKIRRPSSGEYEGNILCANCDNIVIGSYENYARKVLYGGEVSASESTTINKCKNKDGLEYSACSNINYTKFKIFLLSILWRASITSRPSFKDISLGPHEEIIRRMIFDGNAGNIEDYPVTLMTFLNDKTIPSDLISQPHSTKTKNGHTIKVFIISGMIYIFYH